MIDCLLLKSSAAIAAGGVSYTSQNLCQALRFKNFAHSTRFALTFDPFGPSSLRGGHFSDFQLRVKHHFTMFFTSFLSPPESLSLHPVGMARIIGSFWNRATGKYNFLTIS